jgi:GDP-L-fucose synthase
VYFSYGYAKRCLGVQADSYNKQYDTKYNYLIPCNLFGQFDKYGDQNSHFVAALIKKIHRANFSGDDKIVLFGSGKPLRQFMYAGDLAHVIKYCIDNNITDSFNVATPEVYSIKEIAEIALKACDAEHLKIEFDSTKPDGQFRKDVSIEKMKEIMPDDFKITSLY